ncbi:CRP-like cAMP-binding protein/predicted acylesterase/phospholipase RssA [Natronospira proteinivora]|uniref:CRP-like cAMP-binding protein/predicted acylesterase/phospholipase RssA n=1 Tax=Natronospira proteinivora TaxID=1807133 RepID=A0ABT1G8W3_9GAMM|nr:cyclic nucleotide-binding and patatin-like phospholipase domain-containing protein [Natronospira proteinivora]MCP1726743.1 CRP-like cAMP-binding protein/predicted acylesterase/phospholipase RssA [Natronospira proteinivora]
MIDARLRAVLRDSALFEGVDGEVFGRLIEQVSEQHLSVDQVLFQQGDDGDALYIVIDGLLEAVQHRDGGGHRRLGLIRPGDPVGELAVLLEGRRGATVRALEETRLVRLEAESLTPLLWQSPEMQAALEAQVQARIRRNELGDIIEHYFGDLAESDRSMLSERLDWVAVDGGEILFRRGDPGDSLYFIVSGEFWALSQGLDGEDVPIATLGRREVVGEMGLLSNQPRSAAVVAARPSLLVRLSRTIFESLSAEHPQLMLSITRELIGRLQTTQRKRSGERGGCRRIAVVAAEPSIDLDEVLTSLCEPLSGLVGMVSRRKAAQGLGDQALRDAEKEDPARVGLTLWLEEQAAQHELFFLATDGVEAEGMSAWSRCCLAEADEVLVVADSRGDPRPRGLEAEIQKVGGTSRRQRLLLMHQTSLAVPVDTHRWLAPRSLDSHYHVRWGHGEDLARAARLLAHRGVGLALGGHGQGALAQLGALQALDEVNVPVDMVAGSGVGAAVGGIFCQARLGDALAHYGDWQCLDSARLDDATTQTLFGETSIEDLWRPFCCTSTNLSHQSLSVHRQGPLWRAVRASMAIPGQGAAARFDQDIHVDGAILNSLPADLLSGQTAYTIGIDSYPGPFLLENGLSESQTRHPGSVQRLRRALAAWRGKGVEDVEGPSRGSHDRILLTALMARTRKDTTTVRNQLDLSLSIPDDSPVFDGRRPIGEIIDFGYTTAQEALSDMNVSNLRAQLLGTAG